MMGSRPANSGNYGNLIAKPGDRGEGISLATKTAVLLSALLHGSVYTYLFLWAELKTSVPPPESVAIEVVFEAPPEPEEVAAPLPDPPSVPDRQTVELERPTPPPIEPAPLAEAPAPVADQPPAVEANTERAALKPLLFDAEPAPEPALEPLVPPPPPELLAALAQDQPAFDLPAAPEAPPAPAPAAVAPPPSPVPAPPTRKPEVLTEQPDPPLEPPTEANETAPVETAPVEMAPVEMAPVETAQAETPPEPAPTDAGLFSPRSLLANLTDLQNEDLQAERNPELWAVIRALRAQIKRCWSVDPATASNASLVVDIDVAFTETGALTRSQIQQVGEMVWNESYKSFALEARGALQRCAPFDLPAENYDIWRSFTMRFVPRLSS